jgi:hypothetical protein
MGRCLANKYRAWESFCRDQAPLAGSGLQRRGLEASAEYCRAAADEIERAFWTQFWTQTSQDSISPDVMDGMKGRATNRTYRGSLTMSGHRRRPEVTGKGSNRRF